MKLLETCALCALLTAPAALAQSGAATTPTASADPLRTRDAAATMSPSAVLSLLQEADRSEIRLSRMAQQRATSDKVKDYAKTMIEDHQKLDQRVTEFARKNTFAVAPTEIPAETRRPLQSMVTGAEKTLASARGPEFDRQYLQAMSKSHAAVLSDLDSALPSFENQKEVQGLVSDARDKVNDHKKHADDLLKDLDRGQATGGSGQNR